MKPMKSFSQILKELLGGVDPLCTTQEIAGVCNVTTRTVGNWEHGNTEPTYSTIKQLSHYLIQEYNYLGLAMQMMPPCVGRANGRVQDDLMNLYEYGTDMHRAYRDDDPQAFETALHRAKAEMKDLEKEQQEKWG